MSEWIDIEKRQPAPEQTVVVLFAPRVYKNKYSAEYPRYAIAHRDTHGGWRIIGQSYDQQRAIVYWMPVPLPPTTDKHKWARWP